MVRMKRADHKFEDQWREADSAIKAPVFLLFNFWFENLNVITAGRRWSV